MQRNKLRGSCRQETAKKIPVARHKAQHTSQEPDDFEHVADLP